MGGSISQEVKETTKKLFGLIEKTTITPGVFSDEELNIENRVLIGISGTYLILLKEKWENW